METVKLTNNEKSVLVAIVANAKQVGDNGVEFILEDVAKEMGKNVRSISATAGSLAKKGMLLTANGESYFDGVVTEAGLHEVEESDKVNQEVNNNKNQYNMEDKNFDAPVMDERIVKLNELKSVKMAALSKSKRPAAKANKTAAQFVLERWDDEEELKRFISDESMKVECYEVWCIADSRYKQLSYRPEEAPKEDAQPKAKKTASKKETKKADKTEQPKEKAAKTARKVGDVHPKHPTWVWTEYAPGKFDWRTNPKDKKQGQRTDMADKKENKKLKSKAADKKAAKGKEAKQEAPKKAEKPIYTIDEWVALPTKPTTVKSKMSEAQKEAFKLINKGYRITADKKFFQNAEGDNKACNWASVEAMLKRYGIDYVPMGLIKEDKNEK